MYVTIVYTTVHTQFQFLSKDHAMQKPRSALASAQSDLDLRCPLTESLDVSENKEFDWFNRN